MKSKALKIILSALLLLIGVALAYLLNYCIIEGVIIGDECSYDVNGVKPNKIFSLFYEISSNTGYHPEPSMFNFLTTAIIGLLFGWALSYLFFWKKKAIIKSKI